MRMEKLEWRQKQRSDQGELVLSKGKKLCLFFYLTCVARVPVRIEWNRTARKSFFIFGPREKWGESKKVEGAG